MSCTVRTEQAPRVKRGAMCLTLCTTSSGVAIVRRNGASAPMRSSTTASPPVRFCTGWTEGRGSTSRKYSPAPDIHREVEVDVVAALGQRGGELDGVADDSSAVAAGRDVSCHEEVPEPSGHAGRRSRSGSRLLGARRRDGERAVQR
jgi:hypothetical protein